MTTENQPVTAAREKLPGEKLILPGTTIGGEVGTFFVDFVLWNWQRNSSQSLNGLVDTGSTYTQAPASILEDLGVERTETVRLRLADGSRTEQSLGWVVVELQGRLRAVNILFGPEGSSILLGALTLEECGFAADVFNKQLIPADVLQ